ncbi:unnamed protein product [Trifolium pratense]|uniref:Uncharacterized protein n=1 Tax=Trifolium pratense TaxID=57577 RepID=A0ACB0KQ15_TRIPR|nr:unnamed protein product [Trifolium pratense]
MDFMFLKKFTLFFLLISGSLLATSFAGRASNFIRISYEDMNAVQESGGAQEKQWGNGTRPHKRGRRHIPTQNLKVTTRREMNEEEVSNIHERLLRANTKDYGRYDPSPTFSKPPFKLIPN